MQKLFFLWFRIEILAAVGLILVLHSYHTCVSIQSFHVIFVVILIRMGLKIISERDGFILDLCEPWGNDHCPTRTRYFLYFLKTPWILLHGNLCNKCHIVMNFESYFKNFQKLFFHSNTGFTFYDKFKKPLFYSICIL